jgi:EmrB/QacA subfamily drug resistance transporter
LLSFLLSYYFDKEVMMRREQVYDRRRLYTSGRLPGATASLREKRAREARFPSLERTSNPWLALAALIFGYFIPMLDTTVVNIALPTIQTQLHTNFATIGWVIHAYNLMFAVLLITVGRFADQYGRKLLFLSGIIIFGAASLLCGTASSVEWLIGFRVLQGCGAAILNTVSLATVTAIFPPEKRNAALGIWGAFSVLAAVCGPIVGGFLVQYFNWNSIFFINLPFCIVAFIMVTLYVPETRDPAVSKKIDVLGLVALSITLFCLTLAIIKSNDWGWTSVKVLSLVGGTFLALIFLVFVEMKQDYPLIDVRLFLIPSFSASNLAVLLYYTAFQGALLFIGLYYLNAQGYSQLNAAYAVIPFSVVSFVVSITLSRIGYRISPHAKAVVGMILVATGLGLFCTLTAKTTYIDTTWRSAIIGAGAVLCLTSLPATALLEVPQQKLGVGSGVFGTCRQVGSTLGVVLLMSILTSHVKGNLVVVHQNAVALVQANTTLPERLQNDAIVYINKTIIGVEQSDKTGTTNLTGQIPHEVAFKPALSALSHQISDQLKDAVVNAFIMTWLFAALIALLGIPLTLFTAMSQPRGRPTITPEWSSWYFFSPAGSITGETIMQYCHAQKAFGSIQNAQLDIFLEEGRRTSASTTA